MTLKYENFSATPSLNNADPPVGAPEGGTRNKQVNDIIRYVMAALFEVGDWLKTLDDSLGTMSTQDADDVHIGGGVIDGAFIDESCDIDVASLKRGTIPVDRFPASVPNSDRLATNFMQDIYDCIYPIGTVFLTTKHLAGVPVMAGAIAIWAQINTTRYLQITADADYTGTESALQVGGTAFIDSNSQGGHSHGGATAGHVLTVAEMPSHNHSYVGQQSTGNTSGYTAGGTVKNSAADFTTDRGSDAAHSHSISIDGGHTHNVALNPLYLSVQAWRRIA